MESACLSQQVGGCPLINSQLDAEGWSLGSPTGVSQLQKQGKGCGHPSLLHRLHEHMVHTAAAAEPTALCSEEGDAGWSLHLCILLHPGHLQRSSQGTVQAEICCAAANNSS